MSTDRKYRILLLGDASNYHRTLAEGLRRAGHSVTVASDGTGWMQTERDIDISRPALPGKIAGLALWLRMRRLARTEFAGHDIVQVVGSCFATLRPHRLLALFEETRCRNGHVFITALGNDSRFVENCLDPEFLRYNEFQAYGNPTAYSLANPDEIGRWRSEPLVNLCDGMNSGADGIVTALYEYDKACRRILPADKIAYAGIPVDTRSITLSPIPERPEKVVIFVGRHRERQLLKGTDRMLAAAQRVEATHPDKCRVVLVENVPYKTYLELLGNSHIVLDQLYSYTPATNALLAMSMGKVVVSGAEPEYYDFIGEHDNRPIVNAVPDDEMLFDTLERLVLNPGELRARGLASRDFAIKHNDVDVVAKRFLDFWNVKTNEDGKAHS